MAKVAHFYGWTHDYIESMPYRVFQQYLKCIEAVKADDYPLQRNLSIYPKLKKKAKEKLDREMKRIYDRIVLSSQSNVTSKERALEIARMLKNG